MSIRRIWIVGFSVFVVLMFVGLAGLVSAAPSPIGERLAAAALERTLHHVRYDPSYVTIPYPMGDVPAASFAPYRYYLEPAQCRWRPALDCP